jgi:hypothetical protein
MAGTRNDEAVSVIVGTLLLILVTVIAAAGLAIMVSQLQKDEMDRQSHGCGEERAGPDTRPGPCQ